MSLFEPIRAPFPCEIEPLPLIYRVKDRAGYVDRGVVQFTVILIKLLPCEVDID